MNFALAQRIKAWYNAYSFHRNYIGSGIEVVITGLTRNQFAGNTARGFESHPLRHCRQSLRLTTVIRGFCFFLAELH